MRLQIVSGVYDYQVSRGRKREDPGNEVAFAVGLLSSEDILQFPSSFIDFTRSRCRNLRK